MLGLIPYLIIIIYSIYSIFYINKNKGTMPKELLSLSHLLGLIIFLFIFSLLIVPTTGTKFLPLALGLAVWCKNKAQIYVK